MENTFYIRKFRLGILVYLDVSGTETKNDEKILKIHLSHLLITSIHRNKQKYLFPF